MKKLYILVSLSLASTFLFAQRADDDVNKEIILYREFNPTLNDAEKINLEPSIFKVKKTLTQSQYIESVPLYSALSRNVALVTPRNVYKGTDVVEQTAYAKFGAGTYGNMDGRFGLKVKTTETGELNLWGSFLGTSSKAKYVEYDLNKIAEDEIKAKVSDINVHLNYKHGFVGSTLKIGANYQNLGFNYYGSPLITPLTIAEQNLPAYLKGFDFDSKQTINVFNVNALLFSNEEYNKENPLQYSGNAGFTIFNSKYGYMPSIDKGPEGGLINGGVDLSYLLQPEYKGYVGVRGDVLFQYYNNTDKYEPSGGTFSNLFHVKVNPYYKGSDDIWSVEVGMNIEDVRNFKKNKLYLSPEVKGKINVAESTSVFLNVLGGVQDNTYVDVINDNKYISLYNGIKHSHTPFDLQLGVKSGVVDGVEMGVFGGYKSTDDAMFYINGNNYIDGYGSGYGGYDMTTNNIKYWSNQAIPWYYDALRTGHIGANVNTTLIPYTTLSVTAKGYFYSTKDDVEVFNRPKFETVISAEVNPIQNLTLSALYTLQTGRKGAVLPNILSSKIETYDLKNMNELNIGGEYSILQQFSVFTRVNNVFNQKQEEQPGYRLQGINVLGGFAVKF